MRGDDIDALAHDLLAALRDGSTDALIDGDPLESSYFEGKLVGGVLLDGHFDLRRAAMYLLRARDRQKRSGQ